MALEESIKKAEEGMESVRMGQIEEINLRDVKNCPEAVESAFHLLSLRCSASM